ncbi:MAG TPA: pyridoxal-phosphate dependent enzyme [Gaiellaceae bacterium]|nr:pyridoxal-phosphate dependent enzyme [Gaiellaceae bacterium]
MGAHETDLLPERIEAAVARIDPVFRGSPQFADPGLSEALGREVVVKVETLNPIGSFKARGASVLVDRLEPAGTWVCSTAGNFGQALAFHARARATSIDIFVSPDVPAGKVARMRALGARVEVDDRPEAAAREHAASGDDRLLVVDGRDPAMSEGAGTIGVELAPAGPFDTVVVQVGDGALISGVACWLKSVAPKTRIVGVCASGAPSMARSFAAGHAVAADGDGTIATAIAIREPIPASVARVRAFVSEIVLVDDDDLRRAITLVADRLGVLVEPAGAAGVAALLRHGDHIRGGRVAVILTGAAAS